MFQSSVFLFSSLQPRLASKSVPHGPAASHALFFSGCCPTQTLVLSPKEYEFSKKKGLSSAVPLSFSLLATEKFSICGSLKIKLIQILTLRQIL